MEGCYWKLFSWKMGGGCQWQMKLIPVYIEIFLLVCRGKRWDMTRPCLPHVHGGEFTRGPIKEIDRKWAFQTLNLTTNFTFLWIVWKFEMAAAGRRERPFTVQQLVHSALNHSLCTPPFPMPIWITTATNPPFSLFA